MIDSKIEAIVLKWTARLREAIASAHAQSDDDLRDHTAMLLKSIAHSFRVPQNIEPYEEILRNAKAHGVQRTRSSYTAAQLVADYMFLRETTLNEISGEDALATSDLLIISRIFDAALGASVEEFAKLRGAAALDVDHDMKALARYMGSCDAGFSLFENKIQHLDSSEAILRSIADAVSTLILRFDLDGRFVFVNQAYEKFRGEPSANILGRLGKDILDAELFKKAAPYVRDAAKGLQVSFESEMKSRNGKSEHALYSFFPARNSRDEIVGIVATVQSIEFQNVAATKAVNEQVDARELSEAGESRLRSIFAHASVGFAVSDLDGHILEVNPRFSEITGYSEDELKKMTTGDIIHTADLQMDLLKLQELRSGVVDSFIMENRFIKKDGSIAWVRNGVSLVPQPTGPPLIIRVAEDVTAIRDAVKMRLESEERFGLLADSMPQIVWTSEPNGELDYFNQVWFDYSGSTHEQNVGSGWAKAVHEQDVPKAIERWAHSLKTSTSYETEFRLRRADGEYRWFVARATPALDRNGKVKKWYGTNTDIHDFKIVNEALAQTKEQLESEQQKFRTLVADSNTPMAVLVGPSLTFEITNPSYDNLFNNRELIGRPLMEALPELEGQAFPMLLRKAYEAGEVYQEVEALAKLSRTAGGVLEDRYFDLSYSQILDQEGHPYGVFIQAREVTDRVLSRRQIEETAERLRLAVESANMGTWSLDPQTGVVQWSDRTKELFSFEGDGEVPMEAAIARIHPEDQERVAAAMGKALDPYGTRSYNIEYRILREDGETNWVFLLGSSSYIDTPSGRKTIRFGGTVLDFTDRVLADVALRDAKERAELASAAKSSFLANMSHEIRTPLGAIMGFVSLIKDETVTPQTLNEYISVIDRNSNQLMRIIDDILDLSKVEAGMMLIEHIEFSLIELLSDFASLMGFRARERGINFELKAQTELPDMINSDPTRIRQILTNIVGNAIKFTDSGSVILKVTFNKTELVFEVQDTGRGISAAQAEKLFQPFSQGDASTTRKYGGTGLGLVLTRRLSEALGGSFVLKESLQGVGSRFVASINVTVPETARFVQALGFASEPVRAASVQGLLSDLRILLVEDSPDNQALFSIYLSRAGAKIDIASDGQRGVEMALSDNYDVILMDVQMPIMDGITAVKKLRAQGFNTPIIALTAHAMKEEKIRCLEAGYSGFLSKPIQRAELVSALTKFRQP